MGEGLIERGAYFKFCLRGEWLIREREGGGLIELLRQETKVVLTKFSPDCVAAVEEH